MPAQHDLMRSTNSIAVLDHIRKNGRSTRRDIQQNTGLSWAAVSNISAELLEKNVLEELEPDEKRAGRNPAHLDFDSSRNLTIGIELNAEGITVLLLTLSCEIIDSVMEHIVSVSRNDVISQMFQAVETVLQRSNVSSDKLIGIGIAMQGSIDKSGSISLFNSFFTDWRDVPLKQICEERFGVETHVMHDPVCVSLAEQWQRNLGKEDFILFRLSYGIGMCCVTNGEPITGYTGTAGEIGHMVVDKNGPVCSCGNRGCLESYSSVRGICARIRGAYEKGLVTLPSDVSCSKEWGPVEMKKVLSFAADLYQKGNDTARIIFNDMGFYLGIGIANMVNIFNPKYLIMTGDLMEYKDLFLQKATETAEKMMWKFSPYELIISPNGRIGASMGAALYFINMAFNVETSMLLD